MAKSKQTFNKAERERKRRKSQKEKSEKREERKANNSKSRSFEEMLAYVDENGQLTSSPPDPNKRVAIKAEDIEISIARRIEPEPQEGQRKGIISFFNTSKGYGFIKDMDSRESIFVHISAFTSVPKEGDKVFFKTEQGDRGLTAIEVVPAV